MISCLQSTELSVRKAQSELTLQEETELKSHLSFCSYCQLFDNQNSLIVNSLKHQNEMNEKLSDSEKEELVRIVHEKLKK